MCVYCHDLDRLYAINGGRDRWHVMVKIWRPTQDLARRVFAIVYAFVVFIHSLYSVHLFYKTTQNRPLTAMI